MFGSQATDLRRNTLDDELTCLMSHSSSVSTALLTQIPAKDLVFPAILPYIPERQGQRSGHTGSDQLIWPASNVS